MRNRYPGSNVTVFMLFFLLSLLEALGKKNWLIAGLWFGFGLMFLRADLSRHTKRARR
jgi:hypothetical protein